MYIETGSLLIERILPENRQPIQLLVERFGSLLVQFSFNNCAAIGVDLGNSRVVGRDPFSSLSPEAFQKSLGRRPPDTSRVGFPQVVHGDSNGTLGANRNQINCVA